VVAEAAAINDGESDVDVWGNGNGECCGFSSKGIVDCADGSDFADLLRGVGWRFWINADLNGIGSHIHSGEANNIGDAHAIAEVINSADRPD